MDESIVTVVNRSSQTVKATADGKHFEFPPRSATPLQRGLAVLCRRRAPVMGTEDYYRPGTKDFLLAIKELGHDCSPIEQAPEGGDAFDPETLPEEARDRKVIGRKNRRPEPSGPVLDAAFGVND
jgi:hypothetical protein